MKGRSLALVAMGLAVLTLGPGSVRATVMVEVDLDTMARDAVAIVHGRVAHRSTHLALTNGRDPEPYTVVTLVADEWLKGPGGGEVVLREMGGEYGRGGRAGVTVSGSPRYEVGEEVIVFVERDRVDPRFYRTFGMVQGKFQVRRGDPDVVVRDTEAVGFARWAPEGQMTIEPGGRQVMSVATFRDAIAVALGGAPRVSGPAGGDVAQ